MKGFTAQGVTIKAYVRPLSERSPVVLGETKQMLDWTGFSRTLDVARCTKVPLWNNDKITGHISLSYTLSITPTIKNNKINLSEKQIENIIEIKDDEHQQYEFSSTSITNDKKENEDFFNRTSCWNENQKYFYNKMYPQVGVTKSCLPFEKLSKLELTIPTKGKEILTKYTAPFQRKDQMYSFNKMYPERDMTNFEINSCHLKEPIKATKKIQTDYKVYQFNKSTQTQLRTYDVAVQVVTDDLLEDPLEKSICCDIQNIFRCTHEFTLNIEKKCSSTFNYVTYNFPECVTNNIGKSNA